MLTMLVLNMYTIFIGIWDYDNQKYVLVFENSMFSQSIAENELWDITIFAQIQTDIRKSMFLY